MKSLLSASIIALLFLGCSHDVPAYRRVLQTQVADAGELRIPKIIHQIWHNWSSNTKPSELHGRFKNELLVKHPDWKYMLWTNESSRTFLAEHYPWFLDIYDGYDKPIKRADSLRYFLMDHFGGVYLDMSFQTIKNIEPLLLDADLVAGEQDDKIFSVNMAFMASVPSHPIWKRVFAELPLQRQKHVLEATGPAFFTAMLSEFVEATPSGKVKIYDRKFLYPYAWYEKESALAQTCLKEPPQCEKCFPDAFLIKHWPGSWVAQ